VFIGISPTLLFPLLYTDYSFLHDTVKTEAFIRGITVVLFQLHHQPFPSQIFKNLQFATTLIQHSTLLSLFPQKKIHPFPHRLPKNKLFSVSLLEKSFNINTLFTLDVLQPQAEKVFHVTAREQSVYILKFH
jgi:hypothetical protein